MVVSPVNNVCGTSPAPPSSSAAPPSTQSPVRPPGPHHPVIINTGNGSDLSDATFRELHTLKDFLADLCGHGFKRSHPLFGDVDAQIDTFRALYLQAKHMCPEGSALTEAPWHCSEESFEVARKIAAAALARMRDGESTDDEEEGEEGEGDDEEGREERARQGVESRRELQQDRDSSGSIGDGVEQVDNAEVIRQRKKKLEEDFDAFTSAVGPWVDICAILPKG